MTHFKARLKSPTNRGGQLYNVVLLQIYNKVIAKIKGAFLLVHCVVCFWHVLVYSSRAACSITLCDVVLCKQFNKSVNE